MALKIYVLCYLYFFSCKTLSEIVQDLLETSCLGEGLLGGNVIEYVGAITLCANVYRKIV